MIVRSLNKENKMQEQIPPPFPDQQDFANSHHTMPLASENSIAKVQRFKFHGDATEYFGIWIVNILLTIVTLSLYAPWAKVRRLRYFYGNTEFFRRRFDFTGVPKKILIGRLIAIGLYVAIGLVSNYSLIATAIGALVLYLAVPWLMRATIRFNARNSKYANSRFYFSGTTKDSYKIFFLSILISIFTLGLFFPVTVWMYKRYCLNHLYVGQLKFELKADWSEYMRAFYIPFLIFIAILAVLGVFGFILGGLSSFGVLSIIQTVFFIVYGLGGLLMLPLVMGRIFITTWNNTTVGNSKFQTDCNQWRFAWIVASNWVLRVLSIGFLTAWAAIRIHRYKVESLSLILLDDPDQMMNLAQQDHSAIAEEISDIFDLDISL